MKSGIIMLLVFIPLMLFADPQVYADIEYQDIETLVFKGKKLEYVKSLPKNLPADTGKFQMALIYYRLGNMLTNRSHLRKSVGILEDITLRVSNVYTFAYLGVGYAGLARYEKRIKNTKMARATLDIAIKHDPSHYLPRFYRGMMLVFMPKFMGGDEELGKKDLAIVLEQVPTINRDNDFKAVVYFMYGVYKSKKKLYPSAIKYMKLSQNLAEDNELKKTIVERIAEYQSKIKD